MEKIPEKKRFNLVARLKSNTHAMRGLEVFIKSTHNAWVHLFFAAAAIYLGVMLDISELEWVSIVFAIGLVMVAEVFNTAIEIDIDLTSPDFHPYARDSKDVAAAGVALTVVMAGIVGMIIFIPKIIALYI